MAAQILILLLASIGLGLILVTLGWRGRRLNDHPVCRSCRFDLEGVLPGGVTCPECGAGLKRPKATRRGVRRRYPLVVALGVLLAIMPGVFLGAVMFGVVSGADMSRYKPVGLLEWEGKNASPALSKAAGAELLRRMEMDELDDTQIRTAVETALAIQADFDRPWAVAWGDIIETARVQGSVSKEQYLRFRQHAVVIEIETRARARRGGVIPLLVRVVDTRAGEGTKLSGAAAIRSAALAGVELDSKLHRAGKRSRAVTGGSLISLSISPGTRFGSSAREGLGALVCPGKVPLGPARLEIDLMIYLFEPPAVFGQSGYTTWSSREGWLEERLPEMRIEAHLLDVETVPAETELVTHVAPTDELRQRMVSSLQSVKIESTPVRNPVGKPHVYLTIDVSQAPVGLCHRAFIDDGNSLHEIGVLTTGHDTSARWGMLGSSTESRRYSEQANIKGDLVNVVLRPDLELAEYFLGLEDVFDGEIVLESVPVERDRYPTQIWLPQVDDDDKTP